MEHPTGPDEVAYWVHRVVSGRILLGMPTNPEFRRALVAGLRLEIEKRLGAVNDINRRATSRDIEEILVDVDREAPEFVDLLADLLPRAAIELQSDFKTTPISLDVDRPDAGEERWLLYLQHPDAGVRSSALTVVQVRIVHEDKQLPQGVVSAVREMARSEPEPRIRERARRLMRLPQLGAP